MNEPNSHPKAIPDPEIVRGSHALGIPPPLAPEKPTPLLDSRPDGIESERILPNTIRDAKQSDAEFKDTRVLFVNGIRSDQAESKAEATLYANAIHQPVELVHLATHGTVGDILTSARDVLDQRASFENLAARGIAHEVLDLAAAGKNVHIMAYSRGALITQRGLELAKSELERRGFSDEQIRTQIFSHVAVETVNGASHNMPDGVRAVHYVREGDVLVSQALGLGPASPLTRAAAAAAMALSGDSRGVTSEIRDGIFNRPNGPVIFAPPLPTLDPIQQHLFAPMMRERALFNKTYAAYSRNENERLESHPHPSPGSPPPKTHSQSHEHALDARPTIHILHEGKAQTVGAGHHEIGKVYNYGSFIGVEENHASAHHGLTMYPREELMALTPVDQRAALGASLRDGKTIEIAIDGKGIGVHDVTPIQHLAPEIERQRSLEQQPRGHSLEQSEA